MREFLLCLADDGLPLTGWGDLDPAGLRLISQRLPGGAALPGAGLLGGPEPQPPADQCGHRQADQPSLWQADLGGEHVVGEAGGGD